MADLRNTRLSVYFRNRLLDAHGMSDWNSAKIDIMDGAQPATPETAISTQVLLATPVMGNPAFPAPDSAVGGVVTANAIANGVAGASGTATWARIWNTGRTQVLADIGVGATGDGNINNMELPTTAIVAGVAQGVSALTLTLPMQGL